MSFGTCILCCIFVVLFVCKSQSNVIIHNEIDTSSAECTGAVAPVMRKEIQGYSPVVNKIIRSVINGRFKGRTWKSLAYFVDKFGSRIAGSQNLENAIDFMLNESKRYGLENVHGEDVLVPHWVRGRESATLMHPRVYKLAMLGLGGSIGTLPEGITAQVVVVRSFDELKAKADQIRGKIVVYNQAYVSYGDTVVYRSKGAIEAAKFGAVATLIRSITPFSISSPHTGWQHYEANVTKIPTACITVEDAEMLYRMYSRGDKLVIQLKMEAQNLPPVTSRNTVAEIVGHSEPEKVVVVSGHLDSWDVGQGAMDDGGGAFISWNSLVILKKLGLRPRRTMRAILWTAEEEGLVGSQAYVKAHANETKNLDFVMESDEGTFKPMGLSFSGSKDAGCVLKEILKLLAPLNATQFATPQDGGPDIQQWNQMGVPGSSLLNDNGRYYWFHHSNGDTMSLEDPRALDFCTAVWTAAAYVIADLKEDIPR
ncbi:carboxypeptidase Q isoform X2 [Anabrus simplex]|uniref:carboxypeptidase Q isoform X2 n=1 Tax=Anabrus simplex TaxID=316456 RepID=UPI0035A341F5